MIAALTHLSHSRERGYKRTLFFSPPSSPQNLLLACRQNITTTSITKTRWRCCCCDIFTSFFFFFISWMDLTECRVGYKKRDMWMKYFDSCQFNTLGYGVSCRRKMLNEMREFKSLLKLERFYSRCGRVCEWILKIHQRINSDLMNLQLNNVTHNR